MMEYMKGLEYEDYNNLNVKTAFAKEKTGSFDAEGFFDGSIAVYINQREIDQTVLPKVSLQEHSAPITDLIFIVTHNYGVIVKENTPIPSRLFLISSSLDQTIIIWQLYEGIWSVAQRFTFDNFYCTSISSNFDNEKIYFAFSNGEIKYIDINDATKIIDIRQYEDAPICIAIDINPSSADDSEDEIIITGNSKGKMKCSIGGSTQILQFVQSQSRVLYIDIDPPYILSTFDDGKIFITDKNLSQTNEITPALISLERFKPIMAKFEKHILTHAIKILSSEGQIVTVMKLPNNSYKIFQ